MTFFELIRAGLLADSAENKPPGKLAKVVLQILQAKAGQSDCGVAQPADQGTAGDPKLGSRNG